MSRVPCQMHTCISSSLESYCETSTALRSETLVSEIKSFPEAIVCASSGSTTFKASRKILTILKLGCKGPSDFDLAFVAKRRIKLVHSPEKENQVINVQ